MTNNYRAIPRSRSDIRRFVRELKRVTGFENDLYFPVVEFMELVLPSIIPEFSYEYVTVSEMGNLHGETFPSKSIIRIREDVYERAINGEGRDRMTIAHEIGHLLLHEDDEISLCRPDPHHPVRVYESPEWQADCLGGELLASSYLIKGMTSLEVADRCVVSLQAAEVQLKNA